MPIKQLTEEQVRTWTLEQKDRWWLENVFRGEMPQLTWRSALTGFILGGFLSATNLYVGAKTGITLGVGLTSVILAFAMFKIISQLRLAKDFTILENNAMQSIATAAGYMTAPLIASFVAYMWMVDKVVPKYQMFIWNVVLSLMGVLVAFPMKRRFINDEQQPFPEGRACGVVLDTLYESGKASVGMFQARALGVAFLVAAFVQFCIGAAYQQVLQVMLLGRQSYTYLNEHLDDWYYAMAARNGWATPEIGGIGFRDLGLRPGLDLAMVGAGGLMGVKTTTSLLVGAVINFAILAPIMINRGDIVGTVGADGVEHYTRTGIMNQWAIWWGVTMMVVGSLVALFAKPQMIIGAFKGMFAKREKKEDILGHIELPLWVSIVGLPILSAITAWMAWSFFGIKWYLALLCLPLTFALSLICTQAMALTSWTPTGSLSKITQFTFGAIDRANPATNLMTAGITAEVASNSANLLSDIKPGYMLGGKPRHQAIGHCIGIFAGGLASTYLFYILFIPSAGVPEGETLKQAMIGDGSKFSFPAGEQWWGVAQIIEKGFSGLAVSAKWSVGIAAVVAAVFEVLRIATKGKFPLSPLGIGLGVVLPFSATLAMWIGAMGFWLIARKYRSRPDSRGHALWVESQEPICAGLIAGAAILGIGDKIVEVFVLN